ncbi:MAG: homoserine O-acetyltransferase [Acidobacteria bacterium]|nr:MAG: homoserine O-acetyltransferase [Acidobacteriota bacterium]
MTQRVVIPGVFSLERGGTLQSPVIAVRTWGAPSSNATLICHALTGDADADVWWRDMFGPGHLFDPETRFVVSMNVLGGCSGTTGPTTTEPVGTFPSVTIRDMVTIQRAVLDRIGVTELDIVIGGSMGGMQTLEWAAMYPSFVHTIIPIGVGSAQSAWAIGLSEAQRHAIVTDPAFDGGRYRSGSQPVNGLSTARMIAMCSYRSHPSFAARFGRESDEGVFAVQSYLQHHGELLTERFDANTYLILLDAMDGHDIGRGRGPREAILNHIRQPALVVGMSSDVLYPIAEVRALAAAIPNAQFSILDSPHGHDAFLIDTDKLEHLIKQFLTAEPQLTSTTGQGAAWA